MKQQLKLVLPSKKYLKEWLAFQRETLKKLPLDHSDRVGYEKHILSSQKPLYFKWLRDDRLGINLEKGMVQQTVWWGMVGDKIVGRISFRHTLNKDLRKHDGNIGYTVRPSQQGKGYATEMLHLVLKKVAKLGYKKVLLTCDDSNIPSWKTIEKNGGKLDKKEMVDGELSRFYWIKLK
jgi:predicted acetyltransferase